MTQAQQPPQQPQPVQQVIVNQQPSNGLGVAGFVISLVGWVSCGMLCPLGLLLSLIAMFKPPRGLAIAGTIIGAIGSIFLATVGFAIVAGILGIGAVVDAGITQLTTYGNITEAQKRVVSYYSQNQMMPNETEGNVMIADLNDGWSNPLHYREISGTIFEISSDGPDKIANTTDDVTDKHDATMPVNPPPAQPTNSASRSSTVSPQPEAEDATR